MPEMEQSEPTVCPFEEGDPSLHPYNLPFFRGEKVSVSYGRLKPSFWDEHCSSRVRFVFTFNSAFGLIETIWYGFYRDSAWHMGPDELCIIPPYVDTTLDWVNEAELLVLYVALDAFEEREPLKNDLIRKDFRSLAQGDRCLAYLAQIFLTSCRQLDQPEPAYVEGIGIALAARTLKQCLLTGESSPKSRLGLPLDTVNQVTQYVDAHLSDPIFARDLARQVGLSPDHFARRFKIATGMGPKHFVLKHRMEKVHGLLLTGKYNVTEAAREVGFYDLSHLNRCFRNIFGCSPKAVVKTALAPDSYK